MGFTPNVVDGDIILASWGNEVRDRSIQVFASPSERDAQWAAPPNGAMCATIDTGSLWRRVAGVWRALPLGQLGYSELVTNSGVVSQAPAEATHFQTITVPANRRIHLTATQILNQLSGTTTFVHAALYQDGAKIAEGLAPVPGNISWASVTVQRVIQPTAGSHRWSVYVWIDIGTAQILATATQPAVFLISDIGGV